jgi:hypothetical protein
MDAPLTQRSGKISSSMRRFLRAHLDRNADLLVPF